MSQDTESQDVDEAQTRRVDTGISLAGLEGRFSAHSTGETLGRYVLLRPLGAGGMSVVWQAFDPELDRHVALKLMHSNAKRPLGDSQRLLREAQALARLSHPNVVHVYDVGIFGGEVYLAMERLEGVTLKQWLTTAKPTLSEMLLVLTRAGTGLAAAHDAGLVHLDFKPSNVIVDEDGRVRVVDFGLARAPGSATSRSSEDSLSGRPSPSRLAERLTEDGAVLGTPGYIAPEVLRGQPADVRADQFSFCVTAWEILFGERPPQPDPRDPAAAVVARARTVNRPVPRRARQALERGLLPDPEARFASMRELLDAMRPPTRKGWIVAGLVVAGGIAFAVPRTGREAGPCEDVASPFEELWSSDRRAAIASEFSATGLAFASATWTSTERLVDQHVAGLAAQAADVCDAHLVRGVETAQAHRLRRGCLDDARDQLGELVALFERADRATVEHAVSAAAGLGDPARCGDVDGLLAEAALPTDPARREEVEVLLREVRRVNLLVDAGQAVRAEEMLGPLVVHARQLGHPAALARTLTIAGETQAALGEPRRAAELYDEAVILAESAGLDGLRLTLYADLAYTVGHLLNEHERGEYFAQVALSLHTRIGGSEGQLMRLLVTRGVLATGAGRGDEALEFFDGAMARSAPDDPDLPSVLLDIGGVHYERGAYEVALDYYQRAYELSLAAVGPDHPNVASALENRGNAEQALGRFNDALVDHARALEIHERLGVTDGTELALQLNNVGVVLSGMQRYSEAEAYYERARVALGDRDVGIIGAVINMNTGEARLAQARPGEALGLYRAAWKRLSDVLGVGHPYAAVAATGLGLAELELGDREAARTHFELALPVHLRGGDPIQRAETQLGLARILVDSGVPDDLTRARELVDRARGAFNEGGARAEGQLERVDAVSTEIERKLAASAGGVLRGGAH